jgi:hypothetical protein
MEDFFMDEIHRLMKRYQDQTAPIESRHALELIQDITAVLQDIETRLANIEGRVNYIADKTA